MGKLAVYRWYLPFVVYKGTIVARVKKIYYFVLITKAKLTCLSGSRKNRFQVAGNISGIPRLTSFADRIHSPIASRT